MPGAGAAARFFNLRFILRAETGAFAIVPGPALWYDGVTEKGEEL